ncbi:MAG: glycosyltransferase family 2 protein, partial [Candidatus Omnitrophota bacterium]
WPGEDVELDYRLKRKGYKMLFNPRAIVYHYKPKNMADFSRMMYRYGEAQGMLVRKYGLFRKIHFIPAFSILFFIVGYLGVLFGFLSYMVIFGLILLLICFKFKLSLVKIGGNSFFSWNAGFIRGVVS